MCVFTKEDQSPSAKEWRHEVTWYLCLLLKLSMAVIDYPTTKIPSYDIPELSGPPKDFVHQSRNVKWGEEAEWEDNMRVPIRMVYLVRNSVYGSKNRLKEPLGPWQYGKLFGSIDSFMGGYYG